MSALTRPQCVNPSSGPSNQGDRKPNGLTRSGRSSGRFVLVLAIGFVICLARPIHPSQRFSLFGEDGPIFATQARAKGIPRSFVTTYAGYYHLIPRSVAALATVFPLRLTPMIFSVGACGVAALAAALSWRCGQGMGLGNIGSAILAGNVLLLAEAGPEVVDTLTYVEWYCAAAAAIFVAAWISGYRPSLIVVVPLILVAGGTTPLLVTLLPFAIVTYVLRGRGRYDLTVLLAILGATVIQLVGRLSSTSNSTASVRPGQLVDLFLVRVVDGGLAGSRLLESFYARSGPKGAAITAAVVITLMIAAGLHRLDQLRRLVFLFLLTEAVVLTAFSAVLRPSVYVLANIGFSSDASSTVASTGGRYFAGPAVCVVAALLLCLSELGENGRLYYSGIRQAVAASLAVILLFNVPIDIARVPIGIWQAEVRQEQMQCHRTNGRSGVVVQNAPGGVPWMISLTCAQAFG
jgi:hypothetical protein